MYVTTKENVEDLIPTITIRKTMNEEVKLIVNQLVDIQELLNQMESDTVDYTFEQYLDVVDTESKLQKEVTYLINTKEIKW